MPNRQKRKAEAKRNRDPQPTAVSPRLRMSASKVRRIADLVRGQDVAQAMHTCDFMPHRAAPLVKKTIQQAAANAEENCGMDRDDLYVSLISVDEGFTIPRIRPRAQGRAYRIRKRTCTLSVQVAERDEE
jgi:large subunit ribosomal protein L22